MIISHKHKFIFIKTRKTAGTSIEMSLRSICGDKDIVTPLIKVDEDKALELGVCAAQNYKIPLQKYSAMDWIKLFKRVFIRGKFKRLRYYNHMSASEVRRYVGAEIWNSYYKFCFDRDPMEKFVSLFYWVQWYENKKYESFEEFIATDGLSMTMGFDLYSIDKKIAVDKVYKYEEMDAGLADISQRLRLKRPLQLYKYKAKAGIKGEKRPARELLSEKEQNLLATAFAREIKHLEYAI